jgi:prefoldin beta subunit
MTSDYTNQLHLLQQNLQNILIQKQQFEQQEIEISSALKELPTSSGSFQIIGKLMINKSKETLIKELNEKKEVVDLRIKSIEKQENKIKEMLEETQKKMLESLKEQ